MRKRRISPEDVELVLRAGDGFLEDDGTWRYELDRLAVVIVEREDDARIVTVMRMRKHT